MNWCSESLVVIPVTKLGIVGNLIVSNHLSFWKIVRKFFLLIINAENCDFIGFSIHIANLQYVSVIPRVSLNHLLPLKFVGIENIMV